ncbi:MAG TPA: class I SAM-dependent methyltransferase [Candidatus Hydrogenedentes bacterium]|nr:class I SAM-dependent methyltransferase [Candidatus Hydrogenedentota bacterium]
MFDGLADRLRAYAEKDGRGYPDWALRYFPVARRLSKAGLEGKRILEIGANENGLARFVKARMISVDLSFEHLRAARNSQAIVPVQADLAALPFADKSVDICVCMDTLEHIPADQRAAAVLSILRVLHPQGRAVIGFPSGEPAVLAEGRVCTAYQAYCGRTISWLEQHSAHGLPDADAIFDVAHDLAGGAYRVSREGNASLRVWEWMWRVLMCGWPGHGNVVFQVLLRWLTPLLARYGKEPYYRTLIWIEPRHG